jgi:hypothetical protein
VDRFSFIGTVEPTSERESSSSRRISTQEGLRIEEDLHGMESAKVSSGASKSSAMTTCPRQQP